MVEGDSYHRYERMVNKPWRMPWLAAKLLHFGPKPTCSTSSRSCSVSGRPCGQKRYYLHSPEEAAEHNARLGVDLGPGQFTPWEDIPSGTDLLFYEGLHGGVKGESYDVAGLADLLVGVVPITNLEWIQKIHRDNAERGYSAEAIVDTILRRMPDYINHICPQFGETDINFRQVSG